MRKTIEEKAVAYAEKMFEKILTEEIPWNEVRETYTQAYLAGATESLASQWRSVDEELPEENQTALCKLNDGEFIVARFDHIATFEINGEESKLFEWWVENEGDSYTLDDEVTHWLPIPPMKGGGK